MQKLEALTFPAVDGREFILTINGEPVYVPAEQERNYDLYDGYCCPYSAAMAGFGTACNECKLNFG